MLSCNIYAFGLLCANPYKYSRNEIVAKNEQILRVTQLVQNLIIVI